MRRHGAPAYGFSMNSRPNLRRIGPSSKASTANIFPRPVARRLRPAAVVILVLIATGALSLQAADDAGAAAGLGTFTSHPARVAPVIKPQPESNRRMAALIAKVPRDVDPLKYPNFPGKSENFFRRKIEQATTPRDRVSLQLPYAYALMDDGRPGEALRALAKYDELLQQYNLEPPAGYGPKILLFKAVAYLREGELQNSIAHHNADSELLPLQGGGIYRHPDGPRHAIQALMQLLATQPSPYAVWLLNLAYMTLGEYPDGVPARWRIPPAVFKSDYTLQRFYDVAPQLGLDVDDLSGSVVMDDFDNDGLLDLMVSCSGLDSQLRYFHNNGDGTFTDMTDAAGLKGLTGGLNMVQGDYNNDGYVDVLVLRGAWMGKVGRYPNSLLRNNGDNTFTDVTQQAGVLSFHPTQTAVWFDYNGDGLLDLFIANESVPGSGAVDPCELYRNNGDGTFTECAKEAGVALVGWFKAVVTGDYNHDGRPDLYLSTFGGPNVLLRNDGPVGGDPSPKARWHFTNVARAAGVTEPIRSFPCWFWDYNNDGWPDIFVCGYHIHDAGDILADYLGMGPPQAARPRLYRNNHDGTFTDVTKQVGLWKILEAMGANYGDLDNDGWLDFYVGTGDPILGTMIPNRMFRNDRGIRFQDVTTSGGFGQLQKGHGIAFGDLNNDGAEDVYSVVGGMLAGDRYFNQLFANPGNRNHWVKLELQGVQDNRSAIGARIRVVAETATGERSIYRTVSSGGSFGASPLRQEIGLGQARKIARVEIFWPVTKKTQIIRDLRMDQCYVIREGVPKARLVHLRSFAWPRPDRPAGTGLAAKADDGLSK